MIVEGMPRKVKRNEPGVLADIAARAKAVLDERAFVEYAVRNAEGVAASVEGIAKRTKVPRRRVEAELRELTAAGGAIAVGQGQYAHRDTAAREKGRIAALLGEFHKRSPEAAGMAVEALSEEWGLAKNVFEAVAAIMKKEGTIKEAGGRVALSGHRAQVSDAERGAIEKVEAAFRAKQFAPPSPAEVEAGTGLSKAEVARAIKILKEGGRLVEAPEGILFHGEAIEEARKRIVEFIEKEGKLESVKFKYIIDTTRKYAIPLLDYFDRVGVTLRVGNTRYLKGK
jgi:selenocysteine-specific elongation factor